MFLCKKASRLLILAKKNLHKNLHKNFVSCFHVRIYTRIHKNFYLLLTSCKIHDSINIYLIITHKTMEKVDKKLFEKTNYKKELVDNLDLLELEEVFLFKEDEKDFKSTVYVVVYNHFKYILNSDKKFSFKKDNDLSGWLIKRVK